MVRLSLHDSVFDVIATPNLPTNIVPTNIA